MMLFVRPTRGHSGRCRVNIFVDKCLILTGYFHLLFNCQLCVFVQHAVLLLIIYWSAKQVDNLLQIYLERNGSYKSLLNYFFSVHTISKRILRHYIYIYIYINCNYTPAVACMNYEKLDGACLRGLKASPAVSQHFIILVPAS